MLAHSQIFKCGVNRYGDCVMRMLAAVITAAVLAVPPAWAGGHGSGGHGSGGHGAGSAAGATAGHSAQGNHGTAGGAGPVGFADGHSPPAGTPTCQPGVCPGMTQ